MGLVSTIKEIVFKETDDPGKFGFVVWLSSNKHKGIASVFVPVPAYDRAPYRAALRAINIKVPKATKVLATKQEKGVIKSGEATYYLIRASFITQE